MNILIASDSFKGSMGSKTVASVIEKALKQLLEDVVIYKMMMADGGEGTVECLVDSTNGFYETCMVKDPLLRPIKAKYGVLGDGKTAVMAMAEASGLMLLKEGECNPLKTSTYGVGDMVLDAMNKGYKKLILGIGGSATNDGGMGFLESIGWRFYDRNGQLLQGCGEHLGKVSHIAGDLNVLKDIEIEVMCDVDNPLLGAHGATAVYSKQKGATAEMQLQLESGMTNYIQQLEAFTGRLVSNREGAGAAGGLGAGLLVHETVTLRKGFNVVKEWTQIESFIENTKVDLIITGEGQMNQQTLRGKLPQGIAQLGKRYQIPVVAFVGILEDGYEPLYGQGLTAVYSIKPKEMALEEAINRAEALLSESVATHLHDFIDKVNL